MNTDILVLADDFTGALDTGMQFAKCGAATRVITDPGCDFMTVQAQVLVIDTETRHRLPQEAAQTVARIVRRAVSCGIRFFYKKTDSALRGNAGAEIEALLHESKGSCVHFLPAFPAIGRTVKDGVLYIQGEPVAGSVFGRDPFEPVTESEVSAILARQTKTPVVVRDQAEPGSPSRGIVVYNAESDEQLDAVVNSLVLDGETVLLAGCAGLAASLARRVFSGSGQEALPKTQAGMLVVCGSVNEVTRRQILTARKAGFGYRRLRNREKLMDSLQTEAGLEELEQLCSDIRAEKNFIIDTNDAEDEERAMELGSRLGLGPREVGSRIADTLAYVTGQILKRGTDKILLLTGGDVLYHTMERMKITELTPLAEVSPGVILTCFQYEGTVQYAVTKSGGFGDDQLLVRLGRMFRMPDPSSHCE